MGSKKTLFNDNDKNAKEDLLSQENEAADDRTQTPTKAKCPQCKEEKLLSCENFYFRKARNKFERICLECKKHNQKELRVRAKQQDTVAEDSSVRATEQSFPSPEKSDKDEIFKVFNLLKQWRDELQQKDPEEFKKIWQEVKDVSKR